jgi:photosystem II stability/assembly factor-like uncharacterized protein
MDYPNWLGFRPVRKLTDWRTLLQALMICFAVFGFAKPGVTQTSGAWEAQAPRPTGMTILGVDIVPGTTQAWTVGQYGLILHSTDGGATWANQLSPTNAQLDCVRFLDPLHGWALGNEVLYTIDGGITWQKGTRAGSFATLNKVDFVDLLNGWACGTGTIMRTTDGGRSWKAITSPIASPDNISGLDFVDLSHGWVVGASGIIYATSDGGASWAAQTNLSIPYGRLSFVSATEGWAGENDILLHTTDGGKTWARQTLPAGSFLIDLFFLDPVHGWEAGFYTAVMATTNGGATWSNPLGGQARYGLAPFGFYFGRPLESIRFADALTGVAAGLDGIIYSTTDGGQTWTPRQSGSATATNRIRGTDSLHVWAANDGGEILYTTDGGKWWNRVNPSQSGSFSDVKFLPDNLTGFAAGGSLWRSGDGGKSWTDMVQPTQMGISHLDTLDGRLILAVGMNGFGATVGRSTDGGATWTVQLLSDIGLPGTIARDVQMVSPTVAYLTVNNFVAKTTDGGLTWRKVYEDIFFGVSRVTFADALNGWTNNANGLAHTTDGGATWTQQNIALISPTGPNSIQALSPSVVWVADFEGAAARSTDGGRTWVRETIPASIAPLTLWFADVDNGWIAGQRGTEDMNAPTPSIVHRSASSTPPAPAALSYITLGPGTVTAGGSIGINVHLTGRAPDSGAVVSLTSSNPAAVPVDPSITVAPNRADTSTTLFSSSSAPSGLVTITATYLGISRSASVFINGTTPPSTSLTGLSLSPASVQAGGVSTATVTLSGPAPSGGAVVSLNSGDPTVAGTPASVTVPGGASSAAFTVQTFGVSTVRTAMIQATYAGVTKTANLTVTPPPPAVALSSITLNPTSVTGGTASTGTVTLTAPAPTSGVVVTLASSNTGVATVPASVTVAGGATTATFTVATKAVTASTSLTISGSYAGVTKGALLTVTPPASAPSLASLTVNPPSVTGGASSTGTVTLTSAAPAAGFTVTLSSSSTAAKVPVSVKVAAGSTSASFTITTTTVTTATVATLTAAVGGISKTATLTVNPSASDTVAIQKAEYTSSKRQLSVQATSTKTTAALKAYVTSSGALIGTLANNGGGRYSATFAVSTNPQNITVKSSNGGTASKAVTLK